MRALKPRSQIAAVAFVAVAMAASLSIIVLLGALATGSVRFALWFSYSLFLPFSPLFLLSLYWIYRFFGRPHRPPPSHYRAVIISSLIFTVSLLPYFVGVRSARVGSVPYAVAGFVGYGAMCLVASVILSLSYASIYRAAPFVGYTLTGSPQTPGPHIKRLSRIGCACAAAMWVAIFLYLRDYVAPAIVFASIGAALSILGWREMIRLARGPSDAA